ncbi:transmembrane adaptor Erv26-domain-containing protein [Mycena galopus ATCC 62051]|nr:transmembrane adaptor Erv26-domain-containing protein [Mycena galopus ATCC 62051]
MGLLFYLSYGAVLVAFAFVTLSLASGLLYVSELIEEHTRLAKSIGQRGIYAIIALHAVLYFSDKLPLSHVAFSIFCHIVYLQNFAHTWPLISLTSLSFIGSCVLVIADHFLWFFHFAKLSQDARHNRTHSFRGAPPPKGVAGFTEIATFFGICVWAAPLFLFLSLSANDNALPVTGAAPDGAPAAPPKYTQNRVSLFRSILPNIRSRSTRTEGILAPHSSSPIPPRSPLLQPLQSPSYSTLTPPRSPRARPNEFDAQMHANDFKLETPPTRSIRGQSSLGQRRSILSEENVFGSQ